LNWVNRLDNNADADLIKRIYDLPPDKLEKLEDLYKNINAPKHFKGQGNFTVQVHGVSVRYDNNGFPELIPFSPIPENGVPFVYVSDGLNGSGVDMTAANNWAESISDPNFFRKRSNGTCQIKAADGNWYDCTWHHHQDGRTMFPVISRIHNATMGGVRHTGGAGIIARGLQGLFDSPIF
jgi:hypothetical protein